MTPSSNRLQTARTFCQVEKRDFANIYNGDLLSNVFGQFLSLFWSTQAILSARRFHGSHLFFSCSFGDAIHTVFNQI